MVGEVIYKSEQEVADQFSALRTLTPEKMSDPNYFPRDKNFFIQVVPDKKLAGKVNEQLHPHFYQIKRAVRQQHR